LSDSPSKWNRIIEGKAACRASLLSSGSILFERIISGCDIIGWHSPAAPNVTSNFSDADDEARLHDAFFACCGPSLLFDRPVYRKRRLQPVHAVAQDCMSSYLNI
jgi:hypothetical protein